MTKDISALSISNLRKTYSNGVEALKGIDLEVSQGDFYALLGPNGAGKTTLIGIVSGLVNKTSGTIKVFGEDFDNSPERAKTFIGVVPQEMNFNIFKRVNQTLIDQAGYYGVSRTIALNRAEEYLTKLGLWDKRNDPARTLSGGMKKRLMIARALVHRPKLLILDEPTAGVDIELRRGMWDFLTELVKSGVTIILTTHYLEEAEILCNRVAIINQGNIVEEGSMKNVLSKLEAESFLFYLRKPITDSLLDKLKAFNVKKVDETTFEATPPKGKTMNDLFDEFGRQKIEIISMRNKSNRLEEVFVSLTSKK